jgi:hypothetical protein
LALVRDADLIEKLNAEAARLRRTANELLALPLAPANTPDPETSALTAEWPLEHRHKQLVRDRADQVHHAAEWLLNAAEALETGFGSIGMTHA